jgi:hypothetical protein
MRTAALSAPGGARGPITGASTVVRAAVPVSMARRPSEVADCCYLRAGGRDRRLNRAAVRDMAAQAGKPRKGDKPGDDLDGKVVGGVTTALLRHGGHAPRAIEIRAGSCGIGRGCGGNQCQNGRGCGGNRCQNARADQIPTQ